MTDEQALKDAVVEKSIAYIEVRNRCPSGEHPDGHFAAFSAASKEFISAVEALRSFRTRKDTEMTTPNVTVLQVGATPEEWSVEAIDSDADGGCDVTLFSGPRARQRAERYAHTEYLRTPKAEPEVALRCEPPEWAKGEQWHWLEHTGTMQPWRYWQDGAWFAGDVDSTLIPSREMYEKGWRYHSAAKPITEAEVDTDDSVTMADERIKFEDWMRSTGYCVAWHFVRGENDAYCEPVTRHRWLAWQARSSLPTPKPEVTKVEASEPTDDEIVTFLDRHPFSQRLHRIKLIRDALRQFSLPKAEPGGINIGDRVRATTGMVIGQEGIVVGLSVEFADGVRVNLSPRDLELVK